jgi:hypothetical protein
MKYIVFTLAAMAVTSFIPAVADPPPFQAELVPTEDGYQVQWPSRLEFVYRIESSPDLETWLDAGLVIPGNGGTMGHNFELLPEDLPDEPRWFHRIVESPDTDNARFLLRPVPGEMAAIEDGVGFAFDLDVFPDFPDRVRIYKRPLGGESWDLIGAITEFAEIRDVRFPRGSTVWIPEEEGSYEVLVQAVDENDQVIGQASRPVHIIPNSPPVVTITGGPVSPSAEKVDAEFTTLVTDPDEDEIRWVEFYDNGVLMGRDDIEPFGDEILDAAGEKVRSLWKGTHSITARAFDSKGAGGPLSEPYEVVITGGNSQPQVTVSSTTLHNGILTIRFDASDPDGTADIASVAATNLRTKDTATAQYPQGSYPYNAIYMQLAGWASGPHSIAVVAVDQADARSYLALTEVVVPGPPPPSGNSLGATLAAVIADDSTLTVSNALYTGEPLASGVFSGGLPRGLQMDEGVAMTTGRFDSWNKGNIAVDTTEDWGLPGDEQLYLRVVGRDTWDAAILEFDVYSPNGQLVIEHQLGSEEYYEFVDRFNDAFAVFVNDVPVSLLPDAADIVAVHSVNDWRNRHLYLGNPLEIRPDVDPAYRDSMVEYDGLTIRLSANALVAPNQTYRVRIVIADVNDFILDSAVFLGKDSLKSIQPQP